MSNDLEVYEQLKIVTALGAVLPPFIELVELILKSEAMPVGIRITAKVKLMNLMACLADFDCFMEANALSTEIQQVLDSNRKPIRELTDRLVNPRSSIVPTNWEPEDNA